MKITFRQLIREEVRRQLTEGSAKSSMNRAKYLINDINEIIKFLRVNNINDANLALYDAESDIKILRKELEKL